MLKPNSASLALLIGFLVLAAGIPASAQTPATQKKTDSKKKAASSSELAGCVDQQEGRYVLLDDRTMNPIADLDADGFPTEGFAKHMGHKVTLRGTSNPGSTRPAFKVRSIETISESCAPASLEKK